MEPVTALLLIVYFSYHVLYAHIFQVEALMEYTVEKHGRIDYLVNNGGGQFMSPLAYMSTKGWNAVIDTNLNGTYYCTKHGKRCVCWLLTHIKFY